MPMTALSTAAPAPNGVAVLVDESGGPGSPGAVVNGPPWNLRAAVRVHDWVPGDGEDRYNNRAVLFVTSTWGKLRTQEDYEDTQRAADFDALLGGRRPLAEPSGGPNLAAHDRPGR